MTDNPVLPGLVRALGRAAGILPPRRRDNASFRNLAVRLRADLGGSGRGGVVMFTSPDEGMRTAEVVMALASSMRRDLGAGVLLVDATFRDGGVGSLAGHGGGRGLADIIQGKEGPEGADACIRPTGVEGVFVLPCGTARADAAVRAEPQAVSALLDGLRRRYDYVLVETGPIMSDARCLLFPPSADAVVILAEEGRTLIDDVEDCRRMLRGHDARDVRLVLTKTA